MLDQLVSALGCTFIQPGGLEGCPILLLTGKGSQQQKWSDNTDDASTGMLHVTHEKQAIVRLLAGNTAVDHVGQTEQFVRDTGSMLYSGHICMTAQGVVCGESMC